MEESKEVIKMEILINTSNHISDLQRFENSSLNLEEFLIDNKLTGVELIQCGPLDESALNKKLIKGVHLRYYPMWLDFWKGDKKALLKQFGSEESISYFYGEEGIEGVIKEYRKELNFAKEVGAKYVVLHVSHVELPHVYNYNFTYSNKEVIDASIDFLNKVLQGFEADFYLLFENLWWPGLDFLDRHSLERLINEVNFKNKGFMLDTAHLINTNIDINTEEEGISYILNTIENLGDLKEYIKGIHFNLSLSGAYVREKIKSKSPFVEPKNKEDFYKNFKIAYDHIFNIDWHKPFTNKKAREILDSINPQFLVYEFSAKTRAELEDYIKIQHKALGI